MWEWTSVSQPLLWLPDSSILDPGTPTRFAKPVAGLSRLREAILTSPVLVSANKAGQGRTLRSAPVAANSHVVGARGPGSWAVFGT
jgi:hypothetical protein